MKPSATVKNNDQIFWVGEMNFTRFSTLHSVARKNVDLLQFVPVFAFNYLNVFTYLSIELSYFTYLFIELNCSFKNIEKMSEIY